MAQKKRRVGVALIGHRFMGRAHSNAWRQVGPFFDGPVEPELRVLCGRDAGETAADAFAQSVRLEEERIAKSDEPGPTLLAMLYANQVQLLGRMGQVEDAARVQTKREVFLDQSSSVNKHTSTPAVASGKEGAL